MNSSTARGGKWLQILHRQRVCAFATLSRLLIDHQRYYLWLRDLSHLFGKGIRDWSPLSQLQTWSYEALSLKILQTHSSFEIWSTFILYPSDIVKCPTPNVADVSMKQMLLRIFPSMMELVYAYLCALCTWHQNALILKRTQEYIEGQDRRQITWRKHARILEF